MLVTAVGRTTPTHMYYRPFPGSGPGPGAAASYCTRLQSGRRLGLGSHLKLDWDGVPAELGVFVCSTQSLKACQPRASFLAGRQPPFLGPSPRAGSLHSGFPPQISKPGSPPARRVLRSCARLSQKGHRPLCCFPLGRSGSGPTHTQEWIREGVDNRRRGPWGRNNRSELWTQQDHRPGASTVKHLISSSKQPCGPAIIRTRRPRKPVPRQR